MSTYGHTLSLHDALPIAWLIHDPCHRVFAIFGFRQIFAEYALRAIAAPAVLKDKGIAMAGKDLCKLGLRERCLIGSREVRVVGAVLVIGDALEEHRERGALYRQIDIGRQLHAVRSEKR